MSIWSEFYKDRVGSSYPNYCRTRYAPFLEQVMKAGKAATYREEGCGIATISKILKESGHNNISIFDLDEEQLELAKANTHHLVPAYQGDILNYHPVVDVIFSHGVIEHFSDELIEHILHRQLACCREYVVHYVPTDGYSAPTFGDERLLPVSYWVHKFKPDHWQPFNDGKDLVLVWRKK